MNLPDVELIADYLAAESGLTLGDDLQVNYFLDDAPDDCTAIYIIPESVNENIRNMVTCWLCIDSRSANWGTARGACNSLTGVVVDKLINAPIPEIAPQWFISSSMLKRPSQDTGTDKKNLRHYTSIVVLNMVKL